METSRRSGVRAGSVWESRMQSDDVKNGIFKAYDIVTTDNNNDQNDGLDEENEKKSKKEDRGAAASEKRRTWKSGGTEEKSPVQIARGRADPCEDQCRRTPLKLTRPRFDVLVQTKKTPLQTDKVRSEVVTPARRSKSGFSEAKEKSSPVSAKKARSESMEVNGRTQGRVRKTRSELCNEIVKKSDESDPCQLRKVNSSPAEKFEDLKKLPERREAPDHPENEKDELLEEKQQNPDEVKEFGVCQEKIVSIGATKNSDADEQIDNGDEDEDGEEEEVDEEIEVEKKSVDVKEVNVIEQTNSRVVDEIKRFNQFHNRRGPCSSAVGKVSPPVIKRATSFYSVPPNPTSAEEEEDQSFPQPQSKLQSVVDVVMWRDVSRSALVFGMGTFLILSSSYANDLKFSFISVVAYMGLVYLAANFVFRSVIHRGEAEREERKRNHINNNNRKWGEGVVVREEEVIWMVRLILPYVNEFLLTLRAFFSGDPATTIKMGVVLFVLARCGSSITIWKMAKLGFFGVFTVPKIFSSYSTYLSAYGEFWVRRFKDAWESCTHKKAVAVALFTLVWNLSSVVARVWAAFMLSVALRYYQQTVMVKDGWTEEEDDDEEDEVVRVPQVVRASTVLRKQAPTSSPSNRIIIPNKLKKLS